MVTYCVCGLLTYDSGKTWLTIALTLALRSLGLKVYPFKPVAGHSAWSQSRTIRYSRELGVLVGDDVYSYVKKLGIPQSDVVLVNPVDLLLTPLDLAPMVRRGGFESCVTIASVARDQVVLARLPLGERFRHLLVEDVVQRAPKPIARRVAELAALLKAESVSSDELMEKMRSRDVERRVLESFNVIASRSDVVIVESFNDAAVPVVPLKDLIDVYLLTAPGMVAVYRDSSRVSKAVEAALSLRGEEGLRAQYVFSKLRPDDVVEVELVEDPEILARSSSMRRLLDALSLGFSNPIRA